MNISLEIRGKTPLLMHDDRLADPDDEIVKQIKAITDKRKKTEQDRREIERLEWYGGLVYGFDGTPAMKTGAVYKSLKNAGKISKQGTQVARALAFQDLFVPLVYDGPREPDKLWQLGTFKNRKSVGISGKRTMRVRPEFKHWSVVVPCILLEDVMSLDDLVRIAERAGLAEGLGDGRSIGYGRFSVEVKAA